MIDQFTNYSLPEFGFVRLPEITLTDKEKSDNGAAADCTNDQFLLKLVQNGFKKRLETNPEIKTRKKEYKARVKKELSDFKEFGFLDYILLVHRIVNFCDQNGIARGFGRGCLTGESLVFVKEKGYIQLKDVQINDFVISSDGNFNKVEKTFKYNCIEDLINLQTYGDTHSELSLTNDHKLLYFKNPFIKNNNGWVENSVKLKNKSYFKSEKLIWEQSKNIEKDDYLVRKIGYLPEKDLDFIDLAPFADSFDDNFVYESRLTNAKHDLSIKGIARLGGFSQNYLLSIKKQKKVKYRVESTFIKLKAYLKSINYTLKDFIEFDGKIHEKYPRYLKINKKLLFFIGFYIGDGWYTKGAVGLAFDKINNIKELKKIKSLFPKMGFYENASKTKNLVQLYLHSKILRKFIQSYFENGSTIKHIPNNFLSLPNEKLKYLLNGLIASDGSDCEEGRLSYDSVSLELIYQVRYIAEKLGYCCSIHSRKPFYSGKYLCRTSYKLRIYKNNGSLKFYNNGEYIFLKIKDKKTIKNKDGVVYDIQVQNNPSYLTDKYIVHNSVGGSLVCYLINIVQLDPIKENLFFERFVSRARSEKRIINDVTYISGALAPDVDIDVEQAKRHLVVDYIHSIYPGKVSKIITLNTLSGRLLIKECGKIIAEHPESEMTDVANWIPKISGFVADIEDAYKDEPKFKAWCDKNPEVYKIALKLRDLCKNSSTHASGYLVSYNPLEGNFPLQLGPEKELVCGFDMNQVSKLTIKVDILGLRCCTVIADVAKQIGLDIYSVDIHNDSIIYDNLQDLKCPRGIFQLEADTALRVTQKVKPKNLSELSDILAIGRPGALAYLNDYVEYKNDPSLIESVHPIWDKILKATYNQPLYQEQMMVLAHQLFQFTLEDAEQIRRAVAKKKPEEVKKWQEKIYKQAEKLKLDINLADRYWKLLDDSSKYSFNRSHAANYAAISALTTFLKFKYPQNFFLSLLKETLNEPNPIEEITKIQQELKYFDIELLPPHLLKSDFEFKLEGKNIRFGLSSIKGISDKTIQKLIDFRKPYGNKFELFQAAQNCKIGIGVLSALIQAGAMDDESYNISRSRLVLEAQIWNILTEKEQLMFLEWSAADEIEFNQEFNFDVIKMILYFVKTLDEKGKNYIKLSRFETIKKNYQKAKEIYQINSKSAKLCDFWHERNICGYSWSYKLFDIFKNSCPDLMSLQEVNDSFEDDYVTSVGIIEELSEWTSRNEKKTKCCKIKLVDETTSITAMFFNDRILEIKENAGGKLPKENDIIAFKGRRKKDVIFIDNLFLQDSHIFMKHSELKAHKRSNE